jgi:hypothetical protein
MLSPQEETQIHRGIDEIAYNLRHLPINDVAYYLVKFDPELADRLASAISFNFFDRDIQNDTK